MADALSPEQVAEVRTALTTAAEAGDATAQYNLGMLLLSQLDPAELPQVRAWWTRAAEAGNVNAQRDLGDLLSALPDGEGLAKARMWLTRAAGTGDIGAQTSLGTLLLDGPDLSEARSWLTKAAEAGDALAQYNLATLLISRQDPPELAEARIWLTKAAATGLTHAEYTLGVLLATMVDPPQLVEARVWFTKAAAAGFAPAHEALNQLEPAWDALIRRYLQGWEPTTYAVVAVVSGAAEALPALASTLDERAKRPEWADLVAVLRRILAGDRADNVLDDLDELDRAVASHVLTRLGLGQAPALPPRGSLGADLVQHSQPESSPVRIAVLQRYREVVHGDGIACLNRLLKPAAGLLHITACQQVSQLHHRVRVADLAASSYQCRAWPGSLSLYCSATLYMLTPSPVVATRSNHRRASSGSPGRSRMPRATMPLALPASAARLNQFRACSGSLSMATRPG